MKKCALTVLVVEDDPNVSTILSFNLQKEGYKVIGLNSTKEVMSTIQLYRPNIILLDWILQGEDNKIYKNGIELCSAIRQSPDFQNIPIIMISTNSRELDKVMGLQIGADDYLSKPFSPNELNARIKSILRRSQTRVQNNKLQFANLELYLDHGTVYQNGKLIDLPPIEFRLLQSFLESPNEILSRTRLITKVWGVRADIELRIVDVHITMLRKVIDFKHEVQIKTVRSKGYKLISRMTDVPL